MQGNINLSLNKLGLNTPVDKPRTGSTSTENEEEYNFNMKPKIRNKEISWLSFNARLLQEASDPSVPLIERIKFLGIFSSNLDEFFRVRVATLKRLEKVGKKAEKLIGENPRKILKKIHETVISQQENFDAIYRGILDELASEKIFIINEQQLNEEQAEFVKEYFRSEVRPALIPLMIDRLDHFPELRDHSIYLAINLMKSENPELIRHALIEVPTDELSRFLILPQIGENKYIILLDDVIRFSLAEIFSIFDFDKYEAYTIKLTRDAELDLDDDVLESYIRKVSKSLSQRKVGKPVRFIYDHNIPENLLQYLIDRLYPGGIKGDLIPGARYHNFKDFVKFPKIGSEDLLYRPVPPLPHKDINPHQSILKTIQQKDILLHYPYQTFDYVLDFLREAAIDHSVVSIRITLYRVAKKSLVVNALINAARNGKKVVVVLELQARFDEEANIFWSRRLQEEGVRVIHSVPKFKIHAKMILVRQRINRKNIMYAHVGTGNFNESTARLYSDHGLFTCDPRISKEVRKVFDFLENNYTRQTFRHLLVSPFNMRQKLNKLINTEIKNAEKGKEAYIIAKLNNVTDPRIIKRLCQASQAGVAVKLLVRGMFSLTTDIRGVSDNIKATGLIDRYLEHSRIYVFCHGGHEKYFLTSADWMPRNLDGRVEVSCPIYDRGIQKEIMAFLNIHLADNVKARLLNRKLDNFYNTADTNQKTRAQFELYNYFKQELHKEEAPPAVEVAETTHVKSSDFSITDDVSPQNITHPAPEEEQAVEPDAESIAVAEEEQDQDISHQEESSNDEVQDDEAAPSPENEKDQPLDHHSQNDSGNGRIIGNISEKGNS